MEPNTSNVSHLAAYVWSRDWCSDGMPKLDCATKTEQEAHQLTTIKCSTSGGRNTRKRS